MTHEKYISTGGTAGWSKFNKSDLLNTMVQPESSWATRALPCDTTLWPGTRCDTCCRAISVWSVCGVKLLKFLSIFSTVSVGKS